MQLSSPTAAQFAEIFQKYIAGDSELREQVERNGDSQELFNVLARNSLQAERAAAAAAAR